MDHSTYMLWTAGRRTTMRIRQLLRQTRVMRVFVSAVAFASAIAPAYAALGDQKIVKDYTAANGWTSIVPMNVDNNGLTDLLSYNATTGRAIVSIGIGDSGGQKIVKDYTAAKGWTSIVPMNVDGNGLTDLLSYNATTGRAIVSIGIGGSGDQKIVKDYTAAKGWTSIVPMNVDGNATTDLLSYNATTGQAIVSIGIGSSGYQKLVKDYTAAKGWTLIVPMNVDRDFAGLTDLLSYSAATGQAIVSIGIGASGDQKIVKDYIAAKGWSSIVPMSVDGKDSVTDLLSYNGMDGRAIVSVGEYCDFGPR